MEKQKNGVLSIYNNKLKYIKSEQCDNCSKLNELYWYNLVIKKMMAENNKESILNNTFIVNRQNIIDFKRYFNGSDYWILKKITTPKNEVLVITSEYNGILDKMQANGEDMYLLQKYPTDIVLFDSKLIFYRFYIIVVLEEPDKKSYVVYNNNSILLGKRPHTIDNWSSLCFRHIYPDSFKYYFGHETYINEIIPKSKELIKTISPIILDLVNDKSTNPWPYYHIFNVDISFTNNMSPQLENITELYDEKLYKKCDIKNQSERVFFNNLEIFVKRHIFRKSDTEYFTNNTQNIIEGFNTLNNSDTIEEFDIEKISSHKSQLFQKYTLTGEYKNYKTLIIIIFVITFSLFLYKLGNP